MKKDSSIEHPGKGLLVEVMARSSIETPIAGWESMSERGEKGRAAMFNMVKVFSVTKARDREGLGERVTEFLQSFEGTLVNHEVRQSSDNEFHCLTIILFLKV
jgi:hypothetical protein